MINWRVRIKNRAFWLALIPAVLLLLQQALRLCGVDFDPGQLEGQLTGLIGTVFSILALLGIVADPTTSAPPFPPSSTVPRMSPSARMSVSLASPA